MPDDPTPERRAMTYWRASRTTFYSFAFALPLLTLYELSAMLLNQSDVAGIRNGADVLLKRFLSLLGLRGLIGFSLLVLLLFLCVVLLTKWRRPVPLRASYFGWMLLESAAYAVLFGTVVGSVTRLFFAIPDQLGFWPMLVTSLGAGVYEELVFRVVLVSTFYVLLRGILHLPRSLGYVFAAVASALIFSGFHYIGPLGDPFDPYSFVYRSVAGLIFSGLYILRGFGITAYTHSLYDLFLTVRLLG
jgi:hypothetical protein